MGMVSRPDRPENDQIEEDHGYYSGFPNMILR